MVRCWRGRFAIIKTSWTDGHPGRRFYACPIHGSQCRWIDWVDPPMCPRSVQIISGLLRARNRHEASIKELTNQVSKLKKYLLISWVGFISIVLFYSST
ncbi:zinc finger, GRF-type containing protein [Tanacetum coccineum]